MKVFSALINEHLGFAPGNQHITSCTDTQDTLLYNDNHDEIGRSADLAYSSCTALSIKFNFDLCSPVSMTPSGSRTLLSATYACHEQVHFCLSQ